MPVTAISSFVPDVLSLPVCCPQDIVRKMKQRKENIFLIGYGVVAYYLDTLKWPERDMFGEIPPIPQKPKNVKFNELK